MAYFLRNTGVCDNIEKAAFGQPFVFCMLVRILIRSYRVYAFSTLAVHVCGALSNGICFFRQL